jgi:hypothetical protein
MTRWLAERHEHLRVVTSTLRDQCANLALGAAVAVLVTQPLEGPRRCDVASSAQSGRPRVSD